MICHFGTFVINLKQDKDRWEKIKNNFEGTNIKLNRFDAIYGSNIKHQNRKNTSTICWYACPYAVLGCGLSHITLIQQINRENFYKYALILEDDAIPLYKDIKKKINDTIIQINNVDKNWDMIKLYCHGLCDYKNNTIKLPKYVHTSTAAYLVSKKGMKKISNMKLKWHIDVQYAWSKLIIYKSHIPMFTTTEEGSHTSKNNIFTKKLFNFKINKNSHPLYYYLGINVIKIPIINYELNYYKIIIIVTLCIIIMFLCK